MSNSKKIFLLKTLALLLLIFAFFALPNITKADFTDNFDDADYTSAWDDQFKEEGIPVEVAGTLSVQTPITNTQLSRMNSKYRISGDFDITIHHFPLSAQDSYNRFCIQHADHYGNNIMDNSLCVRSNVNRTSSLNYSIHTHTERYDTGGGYNDTGSTYRTLGACISEPYWSGCIPDEYRITRVNDEVKLYYKWDFDDSWTLDKTENQIWNAGTEDFYFFIQQKNYDTYDASNWQMDNFEVIATTSLFGGGGGGGGVGTPNPFEPNVWSIDYGPYFKADWSAPPSGFFELNYTCTDNGDIWGYSTTFGDTGYYTLGQSCVAGESGTLNLSLHTGESTQWKLAIREIGPPESYIDEYDVHIYHDDIWDAIEVEGFDAENLNLAEQAIYYVWSNFKKIPIYGDGLQITESLTIHFFFKLWDSQDFYTIVLDHTWMGIDLNHTWELGALFSPITDMVDGIPEIDGYKSMLTGILFFLLIWGLFDKLTHKDESH